MKRRIILALLITCIFAAGCAGCGSKDSGAQSSGSSAESSAASQTSAETSEKTSETKTSEASAVNSKEESKTSAQESQKAESSEEKTSAADSESSDEQSEESSVQQSDESSAAASDIEDESSAEEPQPLQSSEPSEQEPEPEPQTSVEEPESQTEPEPEPQPQTGSFSDSDISFRSIVPGAGIDNALSVLGNPDSISTAPSCIGTGEDKIYTYGDLQIESYPDPSGEKILSITFSGSSVTTDKGAQVGMSTDEIKKIYGEPTVEDEYYMGYTGSDSMHLDFLCDNGRVIEIGMIKDVV